jgi:hypothetical protein
VGGLGNPNRLIVEGIDDRHSVVGLMRHHVDWPAEVKSCPVWIELGGGAEDILNPGFLTAQIKTASIRTLGVMFDADTNPKGRYERTRERCLNMFPQIPEKLPSGGLVTEHDGKRFGVWVMPDNTSDGSLETFLRNLVPDTSEQIWKHAVDSVRQAMEKGASCRECHYEKADLYTWLAWQDPPGYSPGMALTKKILDPKAQTAAGFVAWFKKLYQL